MTFLTINPRSKIEPRTIAAPRTFFDPAHDTFLWTDENDKGALRPFQALWDGERE